MRSEQVNEFIAAADQLSKRTGMSQSVAVSVLFSVAQRASRRDTGSTKIQRVGEGGWEIYLDCAARPIVMRRPSPNFRSMQVFMPQSMKMAASVPFGATRQEVCQAFLANDVGRGIFLQNREIATLVVRVLEMERRLGAIPANACRAVH